MDENLKKLIYEMASQPYGDALRAFLEEKIHKLSDITTITGSLEEKGKLVEARMEAVKILRELFVFLGGKPDTKGRKNQYE